MGWLYLFKYVMARNKRPKYANSLWTLGLFNDCVQHGHNLPREVHIEDDSERRNFVKMTKCDLKIILQKTGHRIQGKDTKFHEAIPPSIRFA
jgi:hypothetical protein